ncbi:TPA: autotransporter outer membrane beta-barrel domain-containing protein, partial [Escherichia coli]|nr:autotransporter outer membrane beta-barrel domain-containing protein [Escherichia coli]
MNVKIKLLGCISIFAIHNTSIANTGDFSALTNCSGSQCFLRGENDFIINETLSLEGDKIFFISPDKLEVTDGGLLQVTNGTTVFGETAQPHSQVHNFKYNIKNGGKVFLSGQPGGTAPYGFGIGSARGKFFSEVEFNISGNGSELVYNNPGYLFAAGGNQSGVTVNINDGGKFNIESKSPFYLGLTESTLHPTIMNISGDSSELSSNGHIWVGTNSDAKLTVTNGGYLSARNLYAGWRASGSILISGHNTGIKVNNLILSSGDNGNDKGNGFFQIQNGANLYAKTISLTPDASLGKALFIVGGEDAPTEAGNINADTLIFGSNNSSLILNHTTPEFKLSANLKGNGNIYALNGESWLMGNNHSFNGNIDVESTAKLQVSSINASSVNNKGKLMIAGMSQVSSLTNSGTLDLRADAPGNVLTVSGNYTGNNGTLLMNTVLGDDSSVTDKLVIKGDASGQTRVAVTNAGGTGAQTLNGIELIHVDGNADSAEFVQAGRIAAGAYDYTLGRGQGSNSGNWYLTSGRNTPDPEPTPTPDPEPTPTPDPDSKPEPVPGGYDNDLRPEAGSYTANMAAANTMFVTRLHDRLGPVQYTDVMTGETKNTSMWMRHEGGHNRWRDGTGQLKTQGNRYVVQLGGDIAQWGWGETGRWHLGVMA